jgi:hypothetical protein
MSDRIGLDAVLYRGTAGNTAATLMTNVRDLDCKDERSKADTSRRGSNIKLTRATMAEVAITFEMVVNDADADYMALRAAYVANTPLAFLCKSASDGHGVDADFSIMKFSRKEPLDGGQLVEVEIAPTYVSRYPAWV